MFYFESDRREIWIKIETSAEALREEIRSEFQRYLLQYDAELQSQLSAKISTQIRQELRSFARSSEVSALTKYLGQVAEEIAALEKKFADLRQELSTPKFAPDQSARIAALEKTFADLRQELSTPKFAPDQSARISALEKTFADLRQELSTPKFAPDQSARIAALEETVANLRQELSALRTENLKLRQEISTLKPAPTKPVEPAAVKPASPPESIFFLPRQEGAFLPNDRSKIPSLLQAALNLNDMEKFLEANPPEISAKFQKLIASHLREVKKFIDRLNLDDLDDEELSEIVTAKYFKLFQRIIFDNLIVAVRRGLKDNASFYTEFLRLLNEYILRCGIYTVNMTSGRRAENVDYENMKPQMLKNTDKNLSDIIRSIESLPYRINYLDEFGELKFLQYAGIMNVYKAV